MNDGPHGRLSDDGLCGAVTGMRTGLPGITGLHDAGKS